MTTLPTKRNTGDLRLWLWSLLPTIHLLAVGAMLWHKDYLNAVTFPDRYGRYDYYPAFYVVPPDLLFDQCHAIVSQTTILLVCCAFFYPFLLWRGAKWGALSPCAVRLHVSVFLVGAILNIQTYALVSNWWWG